VKIQGGHNESQAGRNEIQARRNKNKIRRNENKIGFTSVNLDISMTYAGRRGSLIILFRAARPRRAPIRLG